MDYYSILGVSKQFSQEELKKKYRSLCYKYHPDRNTNQNTDTMKSINEAYETLSDPEKKNMYDMQNSDPIGMIFENLFQGQPKQKKSNPIENLFTNENTNIFESFIPQKVEDLETKIELSFMESYTGLELPISIKREIINGKKISYENEKIYINIEEGIDDGEIILLENKGNYKNGNYSNLKVLIRVLNHSSFERKGLDIIVNKEISFKDSICGFEGDIDYINNLKLKLKSSRGNIILNNDEKIIINKGIKRKNKIGNLIVKFKVKHNKPLTEEQLKLFDEIL